MDLEQHKQKALKKNAEHKKFLDKLKKQKPRNLDEIVQEIHNKVFENTNCLICANCCKTTGPLFTQKDIERIARYLRMKNSAFIKQYLYEDEDGDWVLQKLPCPFLDAENYCIIYEVRPKACREYPHTDRKKIYQINNLTLKNTVICPAAYEVVEELQKKMIF